MRAGTEVPYQSCPLVIRNKGGIVRKVWIRKKNKNIKTERTSRKVESKVQIIESLAPLQITETHRSPSGKQWPMVDRWLRSYRAVQQQLHCINK